MTAAEEFMAWVDRGSPWPQDRAWASTQPSFGAAWDACQDGAWLEQAAQRLGFWDAPEAARAAFTVAQREAAQIYSRERDEAGQPRAMASYDARMSAASRAFADAVRKAVPRATAEAAFVAWCERMRAVEAKIRDRRERNGGVYRGADDWSELPRRPEGDR